MLNTRRHRGQRGLSIVELLIGLAIGLFIVGGAIKLFVDNLTNNRRLLLETRVNQDLRAAADLIARDLRRAGYWRNAHLGVSSDVTVPPLANPYVAVSNASATEAGYSYAKDADNVLDSDEGFGVQRATETVGGVTRGVVQLRLGDAWRTITDPATVDIPANGLTITSTTRTADLWDACPCLGELTCTSGQFQNPNPATGATGIHYAGRPRLQIRQFTIVIRGDSVSTPQFSRQISETVRVRNDAVQGTCP